MYSKMPIPIHVEPNNQSICIDKWYFVYMSDVHLAQHQTGFLEPALWYNAAVAVTNP